LSPTFLSPEDEDGIHFSRHCVYLGASILKGKERGKVELLKLPDPEWD
jgi:hypothetical protein